MAEDIIAPTRQQNFSGVHELSLAGQQNMRGVVHSTDLEMELDETEEVMVRQKH